MLQDPSLPRTLRSACGLRESLKVPQALIFYVFPEPKDFFSLSDQIPVEIRMPPDRVSALGQVGRQEALC